MDKTDLEIEAIEAKEMRSRAKRPAFAEERVPCGAVSALSVTASNGSVSGACAPTGVRHANSRIYRGGRHVVNRAHRRTISAAPQDVSQSRRNSNVGCCSGVARGEPCQIHLRPHTASMSAIIAAFVSGLERRRWGQAS